MGRGVCQGMYVFNGFFMAMRAKYTGDAQIIYYVLEWSAQDTPWADFRALTLGPTDPAAAPKGSLRGQVSCWPKALTLARTHPGTQAHRRHIYAVCGMRYAVVAGFSTW